MLFLSCVPLIQSRITPLLVSALKYYYVISIDHSTVWAACGGVLSLPLCLAKCIHAYIIEEYSAILTSRKSFFHKRYNKQLITNWKNHPEHNFHWHIGKQFNDCPKLCSITDLWASFKHPSPHKHSKTFHGKLCNGISLGVGGQLTPEIYSNETHGVF